MSACKLCHYISSHPAAFGLWASSPPNNLMLNASNKTEWDFHTGIGAAVHATLETEQFTSQTRTLIIDTTTSLQISEREVIPVIEVHEFEVMTFWIRLFLNWLVIQLIL